MTPSGKQHQGIRNLHQPTTSSEASECESNYLLGKGGYVFGSVGLSVFLSVCGQHNSKSYELIGMKFYGGVLGNTVKN